MKATYLLPTPRKEELLNDVSIEYRDGRITALRASGLLPNNQHFSNATFVLPPLANAHDHGRGLKTLAYGVVDAALEAWVPATHLMPAVDPYLVAAAAFGRMATGGIGSVVHCHLPRPPKVLLAEADAVSRAARDIGVRVAFVVPLRDRFRLGYGPHADGQILKSLSADDAAIVSSQWLSKPVRIEDQLDLVEEIASRYESDLFQIQYGPASVERCSDQLLQAIAERSEATGRRVHMHLLESRYVREWADHAYPMGIIKHLKSLGLLSPRLAVAHGTWLRGEECSELAENGVTVSVNTSSNLRLRSGVAPVATMFEAGVRFALGLDALAIDDDDDLFREMRLAYLLHRGIGFEEKMFRSDFLSAATMNGARITSNCVALGEIAVGEPADMLAVRVDRFYRDLSPTLTDPLFIFHARVTRKDVSQLIIAGREVVADGRTTGIDLELIEHELCKSATEASPSLAKIHPFLKRYQTSIRDFYRGGGHRK